MAASAKFFRVYGQALKKTWPILGGMVVALGGLGLLFAFVERIRVLDALYFTCITAMSIGYGDITPDRMLGKIIAVAIGAIGMLTNGFMVSVALYAARKCLDEEFKSD